MSPRKTTSAADFLPPQHSLDALRDAAANCRGCDLYRHATQTVFGEGEEKADIAFIGEQPGDQEDRLGHPFIGPAGSLLNRALADAGMARERIYVTNAVKHFKWRLRGKRRLHKNPEDREIAACHPWLTAEIELVQPKIVVCLGVTAARSAFGSAVRLKDYRGALTETPLSPRTFVTIHPSAILRLREPAQRHAEYARFVADLERANAAA